MDWKPYDTKISVIKAACGKDGRIRKRRERQTVQAWAAWDGDRCVGGVDPSHYRDPAEGEWCGRVEPFDGRREWTREAYFATPAAAKAWVEEQWGKHWRRRNGPAVETYTEVA